jgi:O-antigen ligase
LNALTRRAGLPRAEALVVCRAAVLGALFFLAWSRAWKLVLPGFNVAGTPHHHLGQSIRAAEALAVIGALSFVVGRLPIVDALRRRALGTFAVSALFLAALAGASAFWAVSPGLAVVQGMHLVIWAAFALLVAGARVAPERMTAAFVLGLVVHAAVGFAQAIVQNRMALTVLGERRISPDDPLAVAAGDTLFLRAYGLTPHPNVLAGHLAVGLILCWGLTAGRRSGGRALMIVTWAVMFAALLLTFSRAGLLAAVAGMVAAALWLSRDGVLSRLMAGLGARVAVIAAVTFALFLFVFGRFLVYRIGSLVSESRFAMMNMATQLIADHPVAGVGAGNFSVGSRAATSGQAIYDAVHNVTLLIAAELGMVGLAGIVVIAATLLGVGYRRWHARSAQLWDGLVAGALVALGTVSQFDHYLWTHPQGGLLGAWLVGWWLADDVEHIPPT